jgi:hypothetical protein
LTRRFRWTLAAQTKITSVIDHRGWSETDELPIVGPDGSFRGALRHSDLIRAYKVQVRTGPTGSDSTTVLQATTDIWDVMTSFLETIAAITTPPVTSKRSKRP